MNKLLFEGRDWNFETVQRAHDVIADIARNRFGLDTYPNQIEIITAEQMLDAYASTGMPLFYKHWSFGKHFSQHEQTYQRGLQGLAYEIVINSNPCISCLLEENTAMMQTLVIAHAAFGHNHFFKNNYLFQQWTDPEGILPYLDFARSYIARCEERHGVSAVERVLDAAHALSSHGVHRQARKRRPDLLSEEKRERERRQHQEKIFNDLWRTVPGKKRGENGPLSAERRRALLELPQENILYFLEKSAPRLKSWQREILRIVRHVAQYFYPQRQTKVMNEGCATFCHYRIMTALHEEGRINDGAFLEFLQSHTNVVAQGSYQDAHYGGINPYALGFGMMEDIARIVEKPTEEDRQWFPEIAGTGDAWKVLRHIWANYRDESFIAQFLSPHLIRQWRMFHVVDDPDEDELEVAAIHDERGYRSVRRALARSYDVAWNDPDIEIVDVDLSGDRRLMLQHRLHGRAPLSTDETGDVLQHLADLWGYDVVLEEVDEDGTPLHEHSATARDVFF